MKNKIILITLLGVGLILSLRLTWKVCEKMSYDEECAKAECLAFDSFQMGEAEQQFYDEAVSSWKEIAKLDPHEGLAELCEELGFAGNVAGLVDLCTASLPDYSFIDTKRNRRSMDTVGTRWMMTIAGARRTKTGVLSHKSLEKPVLFYRKGLVYLLYRDDFIQIYEDKDEKGEMRSAMYIKK